MKKFLVLLFAVFFSVSVLASVTVNVNGSSYTIPQTNEKGWGTNVTTWIQAMSTYALTPIGGTFTLTNDLNLGASFGLVSPYYKSRGSNLSTAGILRLANAESIGWRDSGNTTNYLLSVNSSGILTFNGNPIASSTALTASRALVSDGSGTVSVSSVTSTELGRVAGVASSICGISDTCTLTNKTLNFSSNTASNIPLASAVSGQLAIANGGTGQATKAAGFDALSPMTTGGDIIYGGASGTGTRLANGNSGQFLKSNGTTLAPSWASPTIALTAPLVTKYTSGSGTHTLTGSPVYIKVIVVGGGGGGGGGGNSGAAGGGGVASTIKDSTGTTTHISAAAGSAGAGGTSGGAAGPDGTVGTVNSPAVSIINVAGGGGGGANSNAGIATFVTGGAGGANPLGGGGRAAAAAGIGGTGVSNTGGGGGGGGAGTASGASGAGGSAGAYVEAIFGSPASSYQYAVGAGGGAGTGSGGGVGGSGASGYVEVTEYYQ